MKKKIKASSRGLTFSLDETDIAVGTHYRYIVDKNEKQVLIILDEEGKLKVSKKRSGERIKPLFDIRSKEVKTLIASADYLEVELKGSNIVVSVCKKSKSLLRLIKGGKCSIDEVFGAKVGEIVIPYAKVAGESYDTVYQYTITDWIRSLEITVDENEEKALTSGLKDVYDVVSLFCGAGLFDKSWLDTGKYRFVYANDFNKEVRDTYEYNIGKHFFCKDIRDVKGHELPFADVFLSSPCCQAFSNENRHNLGSVESEGKRLLVEEVVRLVNEVEVKPKVVVVENVPQMISKEHGLYLSKLLDGLSEYEATVKIVTDSSVGGYTARQRCIVILSRIGKIDIPDIEILPHKTVKDALSKVDATWFNYNDFSIPKKETAEKMAYVPPGGNWRDIPAEVFKYGPQTHSAVMRRLAWDEVAPTITNVRKNNMMPPNGNRSLSVSEAAALMGLPKEFKFIGTLSAMQQMVANGVTQAIGKFVATSVGQMLDKAYATSV